MPYINQSFIDDLSNQIDIVDLINKRVPLKKSGNDYRAPCPFHGGKNRNFSVNSHKQFYHCFKCGESGGAISFVQKFDHLDFKEAIESIASEFGLSIVYDQATKPVDARISRYQALLQKVGNFYIDQLKTSPAKDKAVTYAKVRGISGEIAKRFELGFVPPGNGDLLIHFENDTQAIIDLKTLGLIKEGEYGKYDFFRDRLMFPIHNSKGNIIAFGGRAFNDNSKAKYLNSSESPVFSKFKELYGLYHARKYSRSMDYVLVVEGYMDVVALHQAGITQVVATLGTATTVQHLQILARTSNSIIFCFDGDAPGRKAAWKALKIVLPVIKPGLMIKFLFLPEGEDPDSLVKKKSSQAFVNRIKKAWPLSQFLFNHLKSEVDFDTIEGKTDFLEKAASLLATIDYETYQHQLIEGLALEVKQNVEQVEKILVKQKQAINTSNNQSPIFFDETPVQDFSNFKEHDAFAIEYDKQPATPKNTTVKAMMSRMISLLLNYPMLANDTIEARVKKIEKSEVLLKLVHSAQIDEEVSQVDLIKPFKGKTRVYQRLQKLCILEPYLSEKQARDEFLSALSSAEKRQENTQIKASIADAKTAEAQQKIMQSILKSKTKASQAQK